jgi:hypothetical protein
LSAGVLALAGGWTIGSERLITFPAKNVDSVMREIFCFFDQFILCRKPAKNPADCIWHSPAPPKSDVGGAFVIGNSGVIPVSIPS